MVDVDLTLGRKVTMTDWMAEVPTGARVSKLIAVIGPNGGGKTALLKPVAFLGWFISQSFQQPPDATIPVASHFASQNEPTEFECTFDFENKLWRYVLHCTPDRVLHEALYLKRERFGYVFIRDWDAVAKAYKIKQQDFGLPAAEARKVRQNVSFIAWAAQFDVPLAKRMVGPAIVTNVNVLGRVPMDYQEVLDAAQYFRENPEHLKMMNRLLSDWDLGLSGVELKEIAVDDPKEPSRKLWIPFGRHRNRGAEYQLQFAHESSGTQGAFVLLSKLLWALAIGGVAVIDEFESDLHPHMLEPILGLFANPVTNPHQAQLLFSCHAIEVLNLIPKAQVMLVQKDGECESTAIRMDAVSGIRSDDNFYAKYMAGAYGAVPNL